eukprot:908285-Heterocapsa_arctica.AAC.1
MARRAGKKGKGPPPAPALPAGPPAAQGTKGTKMCWQVARPVRCKRGKNCPISQDPAAAAATVLCFTVLAADRPGKT